MSTIINVWWWRIADIILKWLPVKSIYRPIFPSYILISQKKDMLEILQEIYITIPVKGIPSFFPPSSNLKLTYQTTSAVSQVIIYNQNQTLAQKVWNQLHIAKRNHVYNSVNFHTNLLFTCNMYQLCEIQSMRKKRKENNLKKESSPCYNVKIFLEIILLLDEENFLLYRTKFFSVYSAIKSGKGKLYHDCCIFKPLTNNQPKFWLDELTHVTLVYP